MGSESTEVYYYAKRGCTADPEDGVVEGEQDPADSAVTPEGWTGIKQYNQRSTTAVGNTARTSTISIAKIFGTLSHKIQWVTISHPKLINLLWDFMVLRHS